MQVNLHRKTQPQRISRGWMRANVFQVQVDIPNNVRQRFGAVTRKNGRMSARQKRRKVMAKTKKCLSVGGAFAKFTTLPAVGIANPFLRMTSIDVIMVVT